MAPTMASKWLEMLKEIAPRVKRVAFLFNPVTAPYFEYYLNPFKAAAPSFAVEAIAAPARDVSELETVIAAQGRAPNGGLIAMPDSFLNAHRAERPHRWRLATVSLPSMRSVSLLNSAACCPTETTSSTIIGARRPMSIVSSRARIRASFPSRPRSSSSW